MGSKVTKSFIAGAFESTIGKPTEEDYKLIKELMPGDIAIDGLFVYKVKLCDNKTDRQHERFTSKALEQMTKMYIGKPGIEDHEAMSKNMHSRVYKTEHIKEKDGYEYVLAYCYCLDNDKNKNIIEEIKAGIRKEVSVGLECDKAICSICGKDLRVCEHEKGKKYTTDKSKEVCIGLLDNISDTYEYSFVAIPAQPKAGVVKQYSKNKSEEVCDMKLKSLVLKMASAPGVSNEDVKVLLDAIEELEQPESEIVKSLNVKINTLEGEVKTKSNEIESIKKAHKAERKTSIISGIVKEFEPVNDKMEDLAKSLIEDIVDVDDEGNAVGEDEAKELLGAEEYKPLFKEDTEENVPETKEADVEDKVEKSKKVASKKIGFTKVKSIETSKKENDGLVRVKKGLSIKEVE